MTPPTPMPPFERARHVALCAKLKDWSGLSGHVRSARASGFHVSATILPSRDAGMSILSVFVSSEMGGEVTFETMPSSVAQAALDEIRSE